LKDVNCKRLIRRDKMNKGKSSEVALFNSSYLKPAFAFFVQYSAASGKKEFSSLLKSGD